MTSSLFGIAIEQQPVGPDDVFARESAGMVWRHVACIVHRRAVARPSEPRV